MKQGDGSVVLLNSSTSILESNLKREDKGDVLSKSGEKCL